MFVLSFFVKNFVFNFVKGFLFIYINVNGVRGRVVAVDKSFQEVSFLSIFFGRDFESLFFLGGCLNWQGIKLWSLEFLKVFFLKKDYFFCFVDKEIKVQGGKRVNLMNKCFFRVKNVIFILREQ